MTETTNKQKIEFKTPFVLWFTGYSGAGKSTLADYVYSEMTNRNLKIERLDGDVVRDVFPNTGFTKEERIAHVKRIGFISSLLERNGVSVIASFISPYRDSEMKLEKCAPISLKYLCMLQLRNVKGAM
jgi:adenylylsulfate kinase